MTLLLQLKAKTPEGKELIDKNGVFWTELERSPLRILIQSDMTSQQLWIRQTGDPNFTIVDRTTLDV